MEEYQARIEKKATGSRDVKLDDQKESVSISIIYLDTSSPTGDWSGLVDTIFRAVAESW